MNEKVKCGLGVSGLLAAGAGLGIGAKALIQKGIQKVKERKAKKAAESENSETK